jgi:hypothetical protein
MKRSEAIEILQRYMHEAQVDGQSAPYDLAHTALEALEKSGMLPPSAFFHTKKTMLAHGYHDHKWETEDET